MFVWRSGVIFRASLYKRFMNLIAYDYLHNVISTSRKGLKIFIYLYCNDTYKKK